MKLKWNLQFIFWEWGLIYEIYSCFNYEIYFCLGAVIQLSISVVLLCFSQIGIYLPILLLPDWLLLRSCATTFSTSHSSQFFSQIRSSLEAVIQIWYDLFLCYVLIVSDTLNSFYFLCINCINSDFFFALIRLCYALIYVLVDSNPLDWNVCKLEIGNVQNCFFWLNLVSGKHV